MYSLTPIPRVGMLAMVVCFSLVDALDSNSTTHDNEVEVRRTDDPLVGLYVGSGCFWHVQYELIQAEAKILGRHGAAHTALVGYAGGSGVGATGRVCYKYGEDNYAKLGHTEVVYFEIPESSVPAFAEEFWKLFVGIDRKDIVDVGADYRAAIGLPGGMDSALLPIFDSAQKGIMKQKMQLLAGAGSDPDTLGVPIVYIYDLAKYPFYLGEVYHQFHDDFGGPYGSPPYPQEYNDLVKEIFEHCALAPTGCTMDGDGEGVQKVISGPKQLISTDSCDQKYVAPAAQQTSGSQALFLSAGVLSTAWVLALL